MFNRIRPFHPPLGIRGSRRGGRVGQDPDHHPRKNLISLSSIVKLLKICLGPPPPCKLNYLSDPTGKKFQIPTCFYASKFFITSEIDYKYILTKTSVYKNSSRETRVWFWYLIQTSGVAAVSKDSPLR